MVNGSSTSISKSTNNSSIVNCHCGLRAPICKSTTPWNKGKKFYGCPKYKEIGGCGFFNWVEGNNEKETSLTRNHMHYVNDELKTKNTMLLIENKELRIENAKYKTNAFRYKVVLVVSWTVFLMYILGIM
ncbi:hypothetical protein REPUB_Repub01dG0146200 [Reevesia pubescens]